MPYYAVGFGHTSGAGYRKATEEEQQKWHEDNPGKEPEQELFVRTMMWDGQLAKTAGPFRKAKQAWHAATKLQKGSSMMSDFPFIVKLGPNQSLSALANKIDNQEFKVQKEYHGKRSVHVIRFVKSSW